MAVCELLLVRHGESEGNLAAEAAERAGAERIALPARDADVALSPTGREQAVALGRHFARTPPEDAPQMLWVSTYRRARETAEIALAEAGLTLPTVVDERLRDRELGVLDGLTTHGVDSRFPEEAKRRRFLGKFYYRPPGGESWADTALRVRGVLSDLDRLQPAIERILVVTHDAVVSNFRYVCEGIEEVDLLADVHENPIPNASITRLVRSAASRTDSGHVSGPPRWTSWSVGDVTHLAAQHAEVTEHEGTDDGTAPQR